MAALIEHSGVVVSSQAGEVCVRITSHSACGSCKAREACGLSETQEKIVEISTPEAFSYAPGDSVLVGIRRGVGARAVLLAYVGALAVLLAVLFGAVGLLGWSEGWAVVASLGGVAAYYVVLWLCRRKIEKSIQFILTKTY